MRKCIATLASLLLVSGLGACLLSLTESFEYDVLDENGLTEIDLTGEDGRLESVDFTTDSTFEDNKDKIKTVEHVEFTMAMYTKNGEAAVVDVDFREPVDPPAVEKPWVRILDGVPVPGGTSATALAKILYEDSRDHIVNFEAFQKLAEGGKMELLLSARTGNDQVVIKKFVIYVAITAGK